MAAIQAIDATTLRALLAELRSSLLPSRFEKAQQSDPHTLQLALRGLEGCRWIELGWQAEAPRLHGISAPPRQGEGSTLAQQLQHGLRGLALVSIEQQGWERVVELGFARRPGEPDQRHRRPLQPPATTGRRAAQKRGILRRLAPPPQPGTPAAAAGPAGRLPGHQPGPGQAAGRWD